MHETRKNEDVMFVFFLFDWFQVTDKYRPTVTVNVTMPAIVLLNPGDEGSLTAPPVTSKEQHDADYWSRRAFIYQMGNEGKF